MAFTDVHIRALIDLGLILFPVEAGERISLLRDVLKAEYEPRTCEAVIRRHATQNKFIDFPALTAELAKANGSRDNQVDVVRSQAAEEMEKRRQRDAQQREEADADLARVDSLIKSAAPAAVEAAKARAVKRLPHLVKYITRPLEESPMLKSVVAGELAGMR